MVTEEADRSWGEIERDIYVRGSSGEDFIGVYRSKQAVRVARQEE